MTELFWGRGNSPSPEPFLDSGSRKWLTSQATAPQDHVLRVIEDALGNAIGQGDRQEGRTEISAWETMSTVVKRVAWDMFVGQPLSKPLGMTTANGPRLIGP